MRKFLIRCVVMWAVTAAGVRAQPAGMEMGKVVDDAARGLTLATVPAPEPFARGTVALEFEGSYTDPIRFSTNEFYTGTAGLGYYFLDGWSVSVLGHGLAVNQDFGEDTGGGAASLLLRWHVLRGDRWSLYADGGGGLAWTNKAVPFGGTTYNYTARVGGGVSFELAPRWHLLGGARYFHLSNGDRHGRVRNPSYDGVEYYVGVLVGLK